MPPGRPAQAGVGQDCAPRRSPCEGCNGTDEDVLTYAMFPQVAPKFFATAREGPEEPRQGSADEAAAGAAATAAACQPARARCATPITYDVTVDGKTHTGAPSTPQREGSDDRRPT